MTGYQPTGVLARALVLALGGTREEAEAILDVRTGIGGQVVDADPEACLERIRTELEARRPAPRLTLDDVTGIAIDRVRFLERRVDELTRDLEDTHRIAGVLIRQAGGRVEVDPVDLLDDDVVIRRVDDPATGRLVLEVRPT